MKIIDKDGIEWVLAANSKVSVHRHTIDGDYFTGDYHTESNEVLHQHCSLWGADEDCEHDIVIASGGGVKCTKCGGWLCY